MEPFRGQYVPDQFSPGFQYSPGSQTSGFAYTPDQFSPSYPLKPSPSPYISSVEPPPYAPNNPRAVRGWRWRLRNFASNFWLWEISACLLTLGLVGLIAWQLKGLDGKPLYYWDHKWSPTSSLALAVTIAKASMMIPVASALGQLKWHWFRASRKLDGMEHFDEASRGVLGSLRLLWRLKLWRLASIGALITVCALSIDALAQNAVHVTSVPSLTYGSSIYRVNVFNVTSRFSRRAGDLPPSNMLSAMYYSITTNKAPTFEQDLFDCYTGNCTYGIYDSLAVDYECAIVPVKQTDHYVQHPGLVDDAFYLDLNYGILTSNTTNKVPNSGTFKDLGPLIARWLVLANPSTLNPAPMALDCAFYWTVKSYESEVKNGVFRETVRKTSTNGTQTGRANDIYLFPDECWADNRTLPKGDPNCTYAVDASSQASLVNWFGLSDFSLTGWGLNDTREGDWPSTYWNYSSIAMQALMNDITDSNETVVFDYVNITASWLASTMTTFIRQMPVDFDKDGKRIYGISNGTTIWSPDIYYNIQWRYLAFPVILVAMSTLFFIATVIFTWGEGGWKSSQLAVVFHGISENDAKAVGDIKSYADMRDVGRNMHVQLVKTETGKKLVSRQTLMQM